MSRLYKQYKEQKQTMEYQDARIKALEIRNKQLEKQVLDLSYILTLTETELCEKKQSLKQALKYSGAL